MHVPSKEIVKSIIKDVLSHGSVSSQEELVRLINYKLKKEDKDYALSLKRMKKILLEIPEIEVEIITRHGRIPERCPVCKNKLERRYTKNLMGEKILVKLFCQKCGYTGREGKWMPKRYKFSLKKL